MSVTQVKEDGAGGSTVYVITNEQSAWACPACGVFATRLKGYRTTRLRHLSCGGRPVSIRWRKARWYCTEPACPRGSFTEAIRAVPAGMRPTTALRQAAGAAVCDGGRTVVQAGRDLALSWPIVQHCLEDYAAKVLPEDLPATEAIGIDETRRGKPVWKQNPTTGKWELIADAWHIGFVDAVGGRGLFGQVEGRNATSVADWLTAQPASWREQVRYVAIDLCATFRAAVHRALPHAAVVVDCFHIVQLAQGHLADLRRRLTWKQHGRRARKGDGIYTGRKLLRRNKEDLTEDQRSLLKAELEYMGTYGRQIYAAWQIKELLRDLLRLAVTHTPDRSAISPARHRFQLPFVFRTQDLLHYAVVRDRWERRSCGEGAKGQRFYDWTAFEVTVAGQEPAPGFAHWLLVRRSPEKKQLAGGRVDYEYAFFPVHAPTGTPVPEMISRVGVRWQIEEDNREAKQLVGLGGYQVRTWAAWHRHVTCAMLALAFLVVQRAHHPNPGPPAEDPGDLPSQAGAEGKAEAVTPALQTR